MDQIALRSNMVLYCGIRVDSQEGGGHRRVRVVTVRFMQNIGTTSHELLLLTNLEKSHLWVAIEIFRL